MAWDTMGTPRSFLSALDIRISGQFTPTVALQGILVHTNPDRWLFKKFDSTTIPDDGKVNERPLPSLSLVP
jgi:hypothetical protein